MKAHEAREKTAQELRATLRSLREDFFNARFQHYNGQLENTQKLLHIRRDIARIETTIREREIGLRAGPEESPALAR